MCHFRQDLLEMNAEKLMMFLQHQLQTLFTEKLLQKLIRYLSIGSLLFSYFFLVSIFIHSFIHFLFFFVFFFLFSLKNQYHSFSLCCLWSNCHTVRREQCSKNTLKEETTNRWATTKWSGSLERPRTRSPCAHFADGIRGATGGDVLILWCWRRRILGVFFRVAAFLFDGKFRGDVTIGGGG